MCWVNPAVAQLTVNDTLSTQALLETLFGGGVAVSNIETTCDTNVSLMQFNGTNSNLGLSTGVIMSTGNALDAPGPNVLGSTTTGVGTPGDSLLTSIIPQTITQAFDACVVEFDIIPLCDTIGINYVFASEEYPEFAPPNSSGFNDVFAFFIEGPGIVGTQNIALIPGTTTPVSINNVNAVTFNQYYVDNTGGSAIEYDGFTTPLLASAVVQACETYHITLAIQDVGDGSWDSAVFLEAGGIGCVSPVLTLNAINSTALGSNVAVEGCVNFGVFTFELDAPLPDTTVFHFTIGGSATAGADYIPFQDSIILPAGQTTTTLPVSIFADGLAEGVETIEIYYVDSSLCANTIYRDTAIMQVWDQPSIPALQDAAFCSDDTVQIGFPADTGQTYTWTPAFGLSNDTISDPLLSLLNTGLVEDTITYTLVTTAYQGFCIFVDSMEAIVRPEIQGAFSVDTSCLGYEHSFSPQVIGDSLISWDWGFGDGASSNVEFPTHTYPAPGSYLASLIVENVWGCRDTSYSPVYVDSLPVVNFSVAPVCMGTPSLFVNDIRPGVNYLWDFGDGNVSTETSPTHQYATHGQYSVLLIATTAQGCVDSLWQLVTVYENPIASFEATSECLNVPNQFSNLSLLGTGTQLMYQWAFEGGGNSTNMNPSHVFSDFGLHQVDLIVTDELGCTDDTSTFVRVHALPVASFVHDSICEFDKVFLSNGSYVPDSSRIQSYYWEFGNGRTSDALEPNIRINEIGTYSAFLKVTTEFGCLDSILSHIEVYPLPVADFVIDPACMFDSAVAQNLSFVIDTLFDTRIVDWTWDWGDGRTSGSLPKAGHVYNASGDYQVELTVITNKGCIQDTRRFTEIYPLPVTPQLVPDTVCFGDQAYLLAIEGDHTDRLEWRHEHTDLRPFLIENTYATPPVVYPQTYYIQAISPENCSLPSIPIRAELFSEKEAEIVLSAELVEIPQAIVNFSLASNVRMLSYRWNLGDGTTSTVATPVHEYEFPGIYEISLHATDQHGCEYDLQTVVEVKQIIGIHVPTAFSPDGDGVNDEFYIRHHLMRSIDFKVFNRWGEKVYESNQGDFRWSGRSLIGQILGEGVYIYHVRAIDIHGNVHDKNGTITLLR